MTKTIKTFVDEIDSISISDLDDERNRKDKENMDIIERIHILEETAQNSVKEGVDLLSNISLDEEQKYGINSDSFIINLGHQ